MTDPRLPRRRFLAIVAAATVARPAGAAGGGVLRWHGRALGAAAEILLDHPDGALARTVLAEAVAEIERLEAILSLYRPDSALARLNAAGSLAAPPPDLVRVLAEAATVSAASDGVFDITVQPLWRLHADSFAAHGHPPPPQAVARVLRQVDWRAVVVAPDRVAFTHQGMAVTLNGIGQGYVTDRVAELLRRRGFAHVLVNLGEVRALGPHADGRPWTVAVAGDGRVALAEGALATSSTMGSSFAASGSFGHLLDPRTGRPVTAARDVTVQAPTATLADALSTAIAVAGPAQAPTLLARFPGTALAGTA